MADGHTESGLVLQHKELGSASGSLVGASPEPLEKQRWWTLDLGREHPASPSRMSRLCDDRGSGCSVHSCCLGPFHPPPTFQAPPEKLGGADASPCGFLAASGRRPPSRTPVHAAHPLRAVAPLAAAVTPGRRLPGQRLPEVDGASREGTRLCLSDPSGWRRGRGPGWARCACFRGKASPRQPARRCTLLECHCNSASSVTGKALLVRCVCLKPETVNLIGIGFTARVKIVVL